MRVAFALTLALCLVAGCEQPPADPAPVPPSVSAPADPAATTPAETTEPATTTPGVPDVDSTPAATSGPQTDASQRDTAATATPSAEGLTPVAVEAGVVQLTPDNTTIQIIGRHAAPRGGPDDPNFRTIVFQKFSGSLNFDPATKEMKSAAAEIDATSLVSHDQGLTSHLKNADFIDVEMYPTIKFASTRIESTGEPGAVKIVGNLTLKDVTKEITIPAKVTNDASGVTVHGQVQLNRRDFNINHERIDQSTMPEIDFTLAVGKKTEAPVGRRR